MCTQITEKIEINNQVVLMRKHVKQAKVHAINKYVKEVRLLQNRKGNETQVAKAKRKAERFLEEINILKKIKPDHVSKLALSKAKDWKSVLLEKTSTLEDHCLAILASYDAVQKEVEKLHSANPDLVSKIPDLVKEWEQKSKFPKSLPNKIDKTRRKYNKSAKEISSTFKKVVDKEIFLGDEKNCQMKNKVDTENQEFVFDIRETEDDGSPNKIEEKNGEKLPKNQKIEHKSNFTEAVSADESCNGDNIDSDHDMEEDSDAEQNESEADDSGCTHDDMDDSVEVKIKIKSDKHEMPDEDNSEISQKLLKKKKISNYMNVPLDNKQDSKMKSTQNFIIPVSPKIIDNIQFKHPVYNESNLKSITVLNLDDLQGLDEIPINRATENEQESDEETDLGKKICDSFFLGRGEVDSVDKDKLGNFSRNLDSSFKHGNIKERNRFQKNEKSNFRNKGKNDFQKSSNTFAFFGKEFNKFDDRNKVKDGNNFKKSYFQSNNQDRLFDKGGNKFHSKDPRDFNRKERRSFLATGKIPFEKQPNRSHFKSDHNNSFKRDKVPGKKDDASAKPIHPSWEAKMKLKELAQTTFQGKRMVFND